MAKKKVTKLPHSEDVYRKWYKDMYLMRKFEEKSGQLYIQQKIGGFCHLYIGQEAVVVGVLMTIKNNDSVVTSYRDHGIPLALGTDPKPILAEMYGKATGTTKGKGGSMHIFDKEVGFVGGHGIVGGQIPLGAGLGFAEKYKGTDNLAICYIGDGAVRQGAFHETLNMAMTWKIPVIFVIENNQYAMGTSVKRTSNVTELYKLGLAYDMPSEPVDAMSVEEVHLAVERAAKRARSGEGPTLLEFNTYRYKGHSMSDPAKYRTKEELEEYKMEDPIEQVRAVILADKIATEAQLADIDKKIKERVLEAVKFAEESPFPGIEEIYTDIYDQTDYPFTQD